MARNGPVETGPYGCGSQLSFSPSGTYSKEELNKNKLVRLLFPLIILFLMFAFF